MRALALCCVTLLLAHAHALYAQDERPASLPLLDVPFMSQSEALCGGAAAAMVMRYWGERGVSAESFAHLVDRSASGIRTDALIEDLRGRGWTATGLEGRVDLVRGELVRGRPVLTLIEDRPSAFHYVVVVAWHDRGVVFHDPARAPFRVMSPAEFDRRWEAADRWMAVVMPGAGVAHAPGAAPGPPAPPLGTTMCDRLVAEGTRQAQLGDLDAAERTLASALGCPGADAARELAGVRLLQRRWAEVADLASAVVAEDEGDAYAWKLLATSRFVEDDRLGALRAWNRAGEPRHDLFRVDGLVRTRHRVVEQLVDVSPGTLLTPHGFVRAERRLAELPSASSTRLEYVPVPSGLAELRASVAERPLWPSGRMHLAVLGAAAAANRELRVTSGSFTGGGEEMAFSWRFWPGRPRVAVGLRAPLPWAGIVSLDGYAERQPFSDPLVPPAERAGARVTVADWGTARLRWDVSAGVDRWEQEGAFGRAGGGARAVSLDERVEGRVRTDVWLGDVRFARVQASLHARSSSEPRGFVLVGSAGVQGVGSAAPMDLWAAGDTGHARSTLLRAHPLVEGNRFRTERLGRTLLHGSLEAQRWWRLAGVIRVAPAVFADTGRTSRRRIASPEWDVDAGGGLRVGVGGFPGFLAVDVAKGLRDGATAVSFLYKP